MHTLNRAECLCFHMWQKACTVTGSLQELYKSSCQLKLGATTGNGVLGPEKRLDCLKPDRKSDWSSFQSWSSIHTAPDSAQLDSELKECFPLTQEAWIYFIWLVKMFTLEEEQLQNSTCWNIAAPHFIYFISAHHHLNAPNYTKNWCVFFPAGSLQVHERFKFLCAE